MFNCSVYIIHLNYMRHQRKFLNRIRSNCLGQDYAVIVIIMLILWFDRICFVRTAQLAWLLRFDESYRSGWSTSCVDPSHCILTQRRAGCLAQISTWWLETVLIFVWLYCALMLQKYTQQVNSESIAITPQTLELSKDSSLCHDTPYLIQHEHFVHDSIWFASLCSQSVCKFLVHLQLSLSTFRYPAFCV
jgi:hypothetical protein